MAAYTKPLPTPDQYSIGFWEAAKRHELAMQYCPHCGTYEFPPYPMCPRCRAMDRTWKKVSGKGKIFAFFTVHYSTHPDFVEDVPYTVVVVQLDEQANLRVPGNMVDLKAQDIKVGMPVEAVFEDVTPEYTLVKWKKV